MTRPHLVLLAGPNGAGKTALYESVISGLFPTLPFINADRLAAERWPGDEINHAYEASAMAAQCRDRMIEDRHSFVSETVFSHPSKIDLIRDAKQAGYEVWLIIVHVDAALAVERVRLRVVLGGHDVPEDKIRQRHARFLSLAEQALPLADRVLLYDNSAAGWGHVAIASVQDGEVRFAGDARPDWAVQLLTPPGKH